MHSSEFIHYEDLDTVVQTHSRHLGPVYEYKEDLDEQLISPREYSQQFIQSVSQWSRQSGLSKRVHSRRTRVQLSSQNMCFYQRENRALWEPGDRHRYLLMSASFVLCEIVHEAQVHLF